MVRVFAAVVLALTVGCSSSDAGGTSGDAGAPHCFDSGQCCKPTPAFNSSACGKDPERTLSYDCQDGAPIGICVEANDGTGTTPRGHCCVLLK